MDGRWIGRDPMNSIGSNNPYSFLLNKLLNSVDWIGLTKIDSTAKKKHRTCKRSSACLSISRKWKYNKHKN